MASRSPAAAGSATPHPKRKSPQSQHTCQYGIDCRGRGRGCRYYHPGDKCLYGTKCRYHLLHTCPYAHPSIPFSVEPHELELIRSEIGCLICKLDEDRWMEPQKIARMTARLNTLTAMLAKLESY